jgi:hypothetical protein
VSALCIHISSVEGQGTGTICFTFQIDILVPTHTQHPARRQSTWGSHLHRLESHTLDPNGPHLPCVVLTTSLLRASFSHFEAWEVVTPAPACEKG